MRSQASIDGVSQLDSRSVLLTKEQRAHLAELRHIRAQQHQTREEALAVREREARGNPLSPAW